MTTDDLRQPAAPTVAAARGTLRPVLLRLHFCAGILVGPFLLVAAITGLLYVFAPQLEQVVYDHELHVPAGTTTQTLAAQVATAEAAVPEGTLYSVRPGPTATDTTQVVFTVDGLPESYYRTAFVNPYDGELRGVLDTYGSGGAMPIRGWLDNLHRNLHLGEAGRLYSELAASWLAVVVAGGLVLWWGRRRKRRAATGRARTLSWHATTGTGVALVLFFLSATGLTWSQFAGQNISEVRAALSWQTPSVPSKLPAATAAPAVGFDEALAAARTAGLDNPVEITPPAAGKAYVVKQIQRSWPEKQDAAAIDPGTGEVLGVLRFADWPLAAKLARWGIDAHMGLLFGLANQIVLAVVMVGLIALIGWGYRMWWQRRPTGRALGRPYPRGSLRRLPRRVLVPLAAAGIVAGWFAPVFGLSLLAFLLLDGFLGWRAHRAGTAVPRSGT
ncbi:MULTISPECIES: PepSY-associated TM helix domain-containing protein [Amycolatopsis]|uniref:PepSY domain-containing protein n=1 Tax=Amycolatopsis thermalba TaxID=944492 RepID=A0ABY4P1C8_9PSEU|nr:MULTISPECIES: PepSY-associated TM helix domain-containing protein [Amycolatopsis]OXM61310.1 peptidase [Amycolatopsis sp. KNN50.9b]UQS26145.1 PepSY domain-containing protein [Amycolatopsis thermalba]